MWEPALAKIKILSGVLAIVAALILVMEQHKILLPQLTREGHARQFPIVRVICYFIVEQVRDLAEELEEYIPVIIC